MKTMQSSDRIRRKAATTAAAVQSKTPSDAPRNGTAAATQSTPLLFQKANGEEYARVELPNALAKELAFAAAEAGLSLGQFVEQAAREKQTRELPAWTERHHRRRERAMASPVDWEFKGFGCLALTDHEVLDYVCQVIVANERKLELLSAREIESGESSRRYSGLLMHDAIVAARAVAQRVRVQGLKATPRNGDNEFVRVKEREPLWLDLPGVKGRRAWSDERLASWVCDAVNGLAKEIREQVYPSTANELELAEALWLAEAMAVRGGQERESKQAEHRVETNHIAHALVNLAAA